MINTGALDHKLDELGLVVFDELHMLDDEHRGFIMELLATKILVLSQEIQIIAMSATLANVDAMARWLKATYYHCTFRPVPLIEHLVCNNQIQTYDGDLVSTLPPSDEPRFQKDPFLHAIVKLATGPVVEGHGVLVFCDSKYRCESLALILAEFVPYEHLEEGVLEKRADLIGNLATGMTGMDPTLEKTIPAGVAFHHAGMTTEERELIAEAYDMGVVKLICCTPTMAAGVNLPARR